MFPGSGADVHRPVRGTDGVLIVFHDDQGVAKVTQPDQGLDQPAIVPLVQPYAGFVQHIEHADETGADLRGEPDALRFTAGEAARGTAERQVIQAHVKQELQPLVDLLEHPLRDLPLPVGQHQLLQKGGRLVDGHCRDLRDVLATHSDGERCGLQPGTVARMTRDLPHVAGEPLAGRVGLRFRVPALDVGDHSLVLGVVAALSAVSVAVADVHLAGHPVQQQLLRRRRQPMPRNRHAETRARGECLDQSLEVIGDMSRRPGSKRSLGKALLVVRHHELRIDLHAGAETRAIRTCSPGPVERELARLELLDGDVMIVRAGHPLGIAPFPAMDRSGQGPRSRSRPRLGLAPSAVSTESVSRCLTWA